MSSLSKDPRLDGVLRGSLTLELEDRGEAVLAIQHALAQLDYDLGPGIDGIYGQPTDAAVKRLQEATGQDPSGRVDRSTVFIVEDALGARVLGLPVDYIVGSIQKLRVLYGPTEARARGRDIRTVHPPDVSADVVTSGTFHAHGLPVGPVIQDGRWITAGNFPHGRGGMAVLKDETIRIGLYRNPAQPTVRESFEDPGNPIREFMGGGALIVKHGIAVSSRELEKEQVFEGGAEAKQFEPTARHVMIGIHSDGGVYLLIDVGRKRLPTLQQDLIKANLANVVMFDGGNAFGYEDRMRTLLGRIPDCLPPRLSAEAVKQLRCEHDVALTGFAVVEALHPHETV